MIHWHHPTFRNACSAAADPGQRISTNPRLVDCAVCKAAIAAMAKATDETLRDAPAVKRRPSTPAPGAVS